MKILNLIASFTAAIMLLGFTVNSPAAIEVCAVVLSACAGAYLVAAFTTRR